ncbi:S8 family peptidase [Spirosoma spitsbergense]|uniref:S8 family peptidase n=1 Tax=Spirosoma spitsbergense TaxID=431554 RepID=UPI0003A28DFE|nr:S8 family peptidase [Spirosoma spitsbergense]
MNLHKSVLLTFSCFFFLLTNAQAQLSLRNTRWQHTTLSPDSATITVRFRDDTLLISAGTNKVPTDVMLYQQTGDSLLVKKINGGNTCNLTSIGLYRLLYINNGEEFHLQPLSDACPERQKLFGTSTTFIRQRANPSTPPFNWPYLDPVADSVAGISLYRAYTLLAGRTAVPVVVGVLDSGVDITHEDLRDVIWTNPTEIADNNLDDDKNGYIDDRNGWNFMGAPDGTTSAYGQPEITQTYVLLKKKYDTIDPGKITARNKRQYDTYQIAKKQFLQRYQANRSIYKAFADTTNFWRVARQLQARLPDTTTSTTAIQRANVGTDTVAMTVRTLLADAYLPQYGSFGNYMALVRKNWTRFSQLLGGEAMIGYNPDYQPSKAIGDNPADVNERYYGSPRMLIGQSQELAMHGSHVAGIIAASRDNGRGMDGVADNVRIMPVSVVPANGDERDKDIANGIRYAVENGAKVLNMSFGKRLSPFKEEIDAAIQFAEAHDVLIVHAAGNNGENYDSLPAYPSARYANGQTAQNVLTVGNSTWQLNENLPSRSSNYGIQTVDLFAPGTAILSTLPNNRYASLSGTSMAAPMTAGVAALLRSYFPKLTAVQVKEILMKSAYKPSITVRRPGRSGQTVPFSQLSRSGGVLNAYEAVKMILSEPPGGPAQRFR